jgi:hypothetical protein
MGISQGATLLHSVKGLSIAQVYAIAIHRAQQAGRPFQPSIDVDISWLVRKFYPRLSVPRAIDALIAVFANLISLGFFVTLVFDPPERHHTKKASIRRSHNREWSRADAIKAKIALLKLGTALKQCSEEDRAGLLMKKNALLKRIRAAESLLSSSLLPEDLMDRLCDQVGERLPMCNVRCICADFQADSCMARRMIEKQTDIILANDSDFACLVGRPCILLKDFNISKGSELFGIEIALAFFETIRDAASLSKNYHIM